MSKQTSSCSPNSLSQCIAIHRIMPAHLLLGLAFCFCCCSELTINVFAQQDYQEADRLGYRCVIGIPQCKAYASYLVDEASKIQLDTNGLLGQIPDAQQVLIPLQNCTCVSGRSQYNTSRTIQPGDTFFLVSNSTYRGLTTYQAVQIANPDFEPTKLEPGDKIIFPIRCACPSVSQVREGVKSLLSYVVWPNDTLAGIASAWNLSQDVIVASNRDPDLAKNLQPFTTLLLPMKVDPPLLPARKPLTTASPPHDQSHERSRTITIAISAAIGGVFLMGLVGCVILWRRRSQRHYSDLEDQVDELTMPGFPRRFSYKELAEASENFGSKLGQGGFGSVFLGAFDKGGDHEELVAIKKLESVTQGHAQFKTEVSIIGSVQHFNLVQLKGFCAEREQRLLVYELVSNGSLDKWLFDGEDNGGGIRLDWSTRVKIALGTARGLAYLHEQCRERILHLDIKPQNILLDNSFNAKVCDFGMSKLVDRDKSSVFTTMRGTPGYMAPDWLQSSITEKVDVYSFGIVLLELVSGERCLDLSRFDEKRFFPGWASVKMAKGGKLEEVVDPKIWWELEENPTTRENVKNVIDLAFLCIQEDPGKRPSMTVIVDVLEVVAASMNSI